MFEFEGGDGETFLMNPDHIVAIFPNLYKRGDVVTESAVLDRFGKVWNVKASVREIIKSPRLVT